MASYDEILHCWLVPQTSRRETFLDFQPHEIFIEFLIILHKGQKDKTVPDIICDRRFVLLQQGKGPKLSKTHDSDVKY